MNYYQVSFLYYSPVYTNLPCDEDANDKVASDALHRASKEAVKLLDEIGVVHKHAYGWPDGSLYRYVCTEMDRHQLARALYEKIDPQGEVGSIAAADTYDVDPQENPWKVGCETLQQYMDKD